jgi:hypothetical protein
MGRFTVFYMARDGLMRYCDTMPGEDVKNRTI